MESNNSLSAGRITNLEYLMHVSKGSTKFAWELIRIFLAENPEELNSIEKAIRERDFTLIKLGVHKLRSTMPFVGLDKVIENEVAEIESLADKKVDIVRIESLFHTIKDTCERACIELLPA